MDVNETHFYNRVTYLQKVLPWLVCMTGAIFYCYEFFLRVAPNPMAADIMNFYKIGAGEFGLLIAYYSYAYTPMQIIVGLLMDHYGPRKLLSLAILCCIAGCYLISAYSTIILGKIGFFLMGFGSAFAFVGVLKLAVNWLPPNKLGLISGMTTALGLLGGIFAETILDFILTLITWREALFYAGAVGILVFFINFIFVKDHPKEHLQAVEDIPNASWKNLFYDLSDIVKNYKFILNGFIGCVLFLPISVFATTWANLFFSQAARIPHLVVSSYLVPAIFLGMAIGGPIAGIISEVIGRRKIIYQVSIIFSALLFILILCYPNLPVHIIALLLFGLGLFTGGQVLVFVVGIELSAKEAAGTATACTNFLVMLGPIVFLPLIGWLLEYQWDGILLNDVPFYSQANYQNALLTLPFCYLLAFLFTFLIHDTHPMARARELAYEEKLLEL